MKYNSLTNAVGAKIFDRFIKNSVLINKEYEKLIKDKTNVSYRERWVDKFLNSRFKGKYIVLMDEIITGYVYSNSLSLCPHTSKFEVQYNRTCGTHQGEPMTIHQKKFLKICFFRAVNEACDEGYIELACVDNLGNSVSYAIKRHNIAKFQWHEIEKKTFDEMSRVYMDDRDLEPYTVVRMLTFNEMVERKLIRENCAAKKIPIILEEEQVYAKSKDDAYYVAMREHPDWFIKGVK